MTLGATQWDALIVGGGHNGLVCAAYLAKAGLGVVVLEQRDILGGACSTEELFPGHRFSTCSYFCYLLQRKIIEDLALRKHGFEVYHLNPSRFHPFPDGRGFLVWDEVERTQAEIGRFSKHDADAYPRWVMFWERAARIVYPYFLTPPPTLAELGARVRGTEDEGLLDKLLTATMVDLVREFFEDESVRGAFIHAHDVGDPAAPGSAWCTVFTRCRFNPPEDVGIVKGGMGAVTKGMAAAAESFGANLQTGAGVERILIENGRAVGVRLTNGTKIQGRLIISNANPKETFLHLVDPDHLPDGFLRQVKQLRTKAASLKFHASLKRLPDFSRYIKGDCDARFLASMRLCPSIEYFVSSWDDAAHGCPSRTPVIDLQFPSGYDRTMAPEGRHIMSMWALYAPVHLERGTWDQKREEVGEQLINKVAEYAPDIRDCIDDWVLFTPLDLERRIGLTDGNIHHIDIVPSQYLAQRPIMGWAHYKTPIENLYLCGAGTHPGGEVTGAPGHNAAHAILSELDSR